MSRFRTLLLIQPGEGFVIAVMFAYIFAVLFAYYVLDPLRKALFLTKFSTNQLPYAYFLTTSNETLTADRQTTLPWAGSRRSGGDSGGTELPRSRPRQQ